MRDRVEKRTAPAALNARPSTLYNSGGFAAIVVGGKFSRATPPRCDQAEARAISRTLDFKSFLALAWSCR